MYVCVHLCVCVCVCVRVCVCVTRGGGERERGGEREKEREREATATTNISPSNSVIGPMTILLGSLSSLSVVRKCARFAGPFATSDLGPALDRLPVKITHGVTSFYKVFSKFLD